MPVFARLRRERRASHFAAGAERRRSRHLLRRAFWLVAFGMVDAYLLWVGDILYPYALCGLVLYPFRNCRQEAPDDRERPSRDVLLGYIGKGFGEREMITKGRAAQARCEREDTNA